MAKGSMMTLQLSKFLADLANSALGGGDALSQGLSDSAASQLQQLALEEAEGERKKKGLQSTLVKAVPTALGTIFGGPIGATAGAAVGERLSGLQGSRGATANLPFGLKDAGPLEQFLRGGRRI